MDIDLPKVKALLFDLGFHLDSGLMTFQNGKIMIHRVVKPLSNSKEVLPVDLLVAKGRLLSILEQRRHIPWKLGNLSVVSEKGMIEMKAMGNNGQDQEDILKFKGLLDES